MVRVQKCRENGGYVSRTECRVCSIIILGSRDSDVALSIQSTPDVLSSPLHRAGNFKTRIILKLRTAGSETN